MECTEGSTVVILVVGLVGESVILEKGTVVILVAADGISVGVGAGVVELPTKEKRNLNKR